MKTMLSAFLMLVTSMPTLSQPEQAELYKWVDENGVTTYSATPPPGDDREVKTVDINTGPADAAALDNMKARIDRADELRENRLKAQQELKLAEEEKAVKAENCRRARSRLAAYQVPNALIAQSDGSRARVNEETRLRELAASREMIAKYCN